MAENSSGPENLTVRKARKGALASLGNLRSRTACLDPTPNLPMSFANTLSTIVAAIIPVATMDVRIRMVSQP